MNKDFYIYLPYAYREELDKIIKKYSGEPWFLKAWNEYKFVVKVTRNTLNLKSPSSVFNKYIN